MARKSIADMDEVLADTLGAIIEAVNIETKLELHGIVTWSEIKPCDSRT